MSSPMLEPFVDAGSIPGAVAIVSRGAEIDIGRLLRSRVRAGGFPETLGRRRAE